MQQRRLGALDVGAIGYGAMVLSPGLYGAVDDERGADALHHAIDRGATLIDTSDSYGADFHNERLIGSALGRRRGEVVIATKFGFKAPDGVAKHAFPVGYAYGQLAVNCEPQYVRGYALGSLQRLQIDQIDLFYPHFPDPEVPIEETVGAMAELVGEGLVAHLGLSNVTADHLQRAAAVHPIAAVQLEWSMWVSPDPDLLAVADANDIGIVAWGPLGGGFLTGGVGQLDDDDFRHNVPRFAGSNLSANNARYDPVRGLARELGITPGQLALAWLLHQHPRVVPIPGSRTPAHIDENLAAVEVVLSREALTRLDDVLRSFEPDGGTLFSLPDAAEPTSPGDVQVGAIVGRRHRPMVSRP